MISGLRQGRFKVNPEHFVMPESHEVLKNIYIYMIGTFHKDTGRGSHWPNLVQFEDQNNEG